MMPPMLSQIRQNGLPSWAYKAALLLAAAIWGMGTVVIKSTVDEFPPAWIVGVRFTFAGIILGIATAPRISRAFARNKRGHLRDGAVLGVFLFLSYWFNSTGLTDTTASNSSFLTTLYCVIIPFLGWIIIRKRPTRYNIAAAILCVTGVGCVAYAGIGEFSLRFGSLAELPRAVHGEVRAGTLYDAAHGHSVHRGGPAGTHHRAYHRARTQLQPVERRHLDEPHLHHRVCLLCGPRIAKRRRGPR